MSFIKKLLLMITCISLIFAFGCMSNSGGDENSSVKESTAEESLSSEQDSSEESQSHEDSIIEESQSQEESTSESESIGEVDPPVNDDFDLLETDGRFVAIDIQEKISTEEGRMSFITKTGYKGIKRISFNAKTGNTVSWWGIAITDAPSTASVYNTDLTLWMGTGGYWTTLVYEFVQTGCTIYTAQGEYNPKEIKELANVPYSEDGEYYVYFVGPLWETFSEPVCIDNFTIELFDGSTYTDSFDDSTDGGLFNADGAVSHVVDESIENPYIGEEETPLYQTDEVFYTSDEVIDFTAYSPVTVGNWAGTSTPNPNLVTDEQYRYMAEAGFTKSLGLYEGRTGNSGYTSNEKAELDALAVLEIAQKHGIRYYVLNELFYNFVRPDINIEFFDLTSKSGAFYNRYGEEVSSYDSYKYLKSDWKELYRAKISEMFSADTRYIDSIAYAGNFASDEPNLPVFENGEWYYGELEQIYYQISIYNKYVSMNGLQGGEAYINLLPYGSTDPYVRERYNEMLNYYFENIAPLVGYVSYDQYPLNYSYTSYISATHLLNLEIMANYCKQYDVELRSFIWSKTKASAGHRAIFNANDIRFQAYANLAFGVKEMPYFTYFNYYNQGANACDSLIDCYTGERTDLYYWVKEVNNEIHTLEKAYLSFKWQGSMCFDAGAKNEQFSLLETALTSHNRLTEVNGGADFLIGVFTDEDGLNGKKDGFVVMNYSDPYYAKRDAKDNVVLTFANATHALVYKDGKQYVAELSSGKLSLYLEAGEGAFVVPFNR